MAQARQGRAGDGPLAALLPLWAGLLLAFGADRFPVLNLRAFLLPLAAACAVAGAWALVRAQRWTGAGMLLAGLLACWPWVQVRMGRQAEPAGPAVLQVAQMNILQDNTDRAGVLATARASHAAVISVQEVDSAWYRSLVAGLGDRYPWHGFTPGEKNYGLALFSKVPFVKLAQVDLEGLPAFRAVMPAGDRHVTLYAVHLRAPESAAKVRQRSRQWAALAAWIAADTGAVCVVGDLNTVPWDDSFKEFLQRTGLHPVDGGLRPTWPASAALAPLDHVLAGRGIRAGHSRVFPIPGSDHCGIRADLLLEGCGRCPAPQR